MLPYTALLALALTSLVTPVSAMWPNSWVVGNTCESISGKNFDNCTSQNHECLCSNKNFLASVAYCIQDNLQTTEDVDKAWDYVLVTNCKVSAVESDRLYRNSIDYLNRTQVTTLEKFSNYSAIYNSPVSAHKETVRETYTSIYLNLHNRDISTWQGSVLVMIWVIVMGITSLYRFLRYISVTFGPKSQSMGRPNKLVRLYYKYISIPAAFGHRHIDRYYLFNFIPIFIPTRFESIVIAFYILLTIIFMSTGYSFMHNNPLWASHYSELVLNVSNRAGIMASIQIPLLTLFALRNNVLIWLTGWSFSTFNAYHRAIARVTFLLAVIHAAAKHTMMLSFHAPLRMIYYPTLLFRLGVAALSLWSLMLLLGFFRVKYYELFLFVHVIGAVAAYICILFHLNHLGYKQSIYVSLGLIAADLLIRIGRIVFSNFSMYLKPVEGSKRLTKASVSLLPSDVLNVRIRTPIQWPFAPGQYVYIHFNRLNILESHPFSAVGPSSDGESFQLLCKARGGITKRLRNYLVSNGAEKGQKVDMSVLIEGPYGVHCPVERYDTILLVAGGIGITGIVPYAEYLALSPHYHEIHLIWTVSSVDELTWIEERLQWLSETGKVHIKLYVTRGPKKGIVTNGEKNDISLNDLSNSKMDLPIVETSADNKYNEADNIHLVGNNSVIPYPLDQGLRKKMSIRKHIKNISQSSNVFQLDIDQRMENVDGTQMVDWTDENRPNRFSHLHQVLHPNKGGNTASQDSMEMDQRKDLSSNDQYQPETTSYPSTYRYSYSPGKKTSAIKNSQPQTNNQRKNSNSHTSISVQEISNSQLWMSHVIEGSRPNLQDTIQELFRESSGSVCIVGCGPSRMMDTLRRSTCINYDLVENGRVDYYEEAFTW